MKTSFVKVLAVTGVLGLASLAVVAQKTRQFDPAQRIQHHVDMLTKKLSLTPAQQQQATTIFTNAANTQKALRDQMKAAHDSMKAAVDKNDSAAIDQAATTIGNNTAQMIAARAKARAAFFQTLNPDQQKQLTDMEGKMRGRGGWGRHGHRGHGGPGMGPGGPPEGQF